MSKLYAVNNRESSHLLTNVKLTEKKLKNPIHLAFLLLLPSHPHPHRPHLYHHLIDINTKEFL